MIETSPNHKGEEISHPSERADTSKKMFEITILRNSKTNLGFVNIKLLNVTKAAL